MCNYKKSPIDELFHRLMGYYPTKEGTAFEIISTAVLSIIEKKNAEHNQFLTGQSDSRYQLDGLIDKEIMVESKDYTKSKEKVGRDDLQKLEGALTDLPNIKKGYFASATEYTDPAKKYATASSTNPYQKEIVAFELRPSTEEDKKGRMSTIEVNLTVIFPVFKQGKYNVLFADDNERRNFENYLKELQLQEIHLPIVQFYNSKGEVIETMENLSCLQQPKIPNDATEVEGIFEISAYIKIKEKLFAIKGIEYKHVPIKQITEVFTIESNGNATMLIKSDKLGINKLVTDTDMVNAMLNILEKSK